MKTWMTYKMNVLHQSRSIVQKGNNPQKTNTRHWVVRNTRRYWKYCTLLTIYELANAYKKKSCEIHTHSLVYGKTDTNKRKSRVRWHRNRCRRCGSRDATAHTCVQNEEQQHAKQVIRVANKISFIVEKISSKTGLFFNIFPVRYSFFFRNRE